MIKRKNYLAILLIGLSLSACASGGGAGIAVRDLAADQPGPLRCLGLEGHDVLLISREVVRDIKDSFLKENPGIIKEGKPIRIIVDSKFFTNETRQAVSLNMITDQLAADLQRAAGKQIAFLSRENVAAVAQERALKRQGAVDRGALGLADKVAGADYRMTGRISAITAQREETQQQTTNIALRLLDLETGQRVWSWTKNLSKGGQDGIYCQ